MKTQNCISTFSFTVTVLLIGAPQALASPLLDSDLASFTVLGASSERYIPKLTGEGVGGRSESARAIAAINASAASAGSANPGVGAAAMELAQALHLAGNPGRETLGRGPSGDGRVGDTRKPSETPDRDNRDLARKYLCAQDNTAATPFDLDLCNDLPTLNDFPAAASTPINPSLDQPRPSSEGDIGKLPEDLQRQLLLATLPVDPGPGPGDVASGLPIQSQAPDIGQDFAAFPSALAVDELAAAVPEPASLILFALGLAGIGYTRARRA